MSGQRPWYAESGVLPPDCPTPGCPYSANVCPGHAAPSQPEQEDQP